MTRNSNIQGKGDILTEQQFSKAQTHELSGSIRERLDGFFMVEIEGTCDTTGQMDL